MKKSTLLLVLSALGSGTATAAVNGYPVVLVHGFQPDNLASRPVGSIVSDNGDRYWAKFWRDRADVRIDWPSQERIAGKIATEHAWPVLQQLSRNGTCQQGCIFVTHSTGDLVTRYLIDNQALWLENAGMQPLNIVATFDFAGAGGGSELADLAVNVATGSGLIDTALRYALSLWLGELPNANNVGVLNDLRVNSARQLAPLPDTRVPRLRFVGAASGYLGTTSPFLPGKDDGVVATHSSCGSATAGNYSSCSTSVAFNGKLAYQSEGVSQYLPYHYPMLMSAGYTHSSVIDNLIDDEITAVNASASYLDQQSLQFATREENRGWWIFKSRYRVVEGSDNASLSELVYQAASAP